MKSFADDYKHRGIRFQVYNPIDLYPDKEKRENFTDSWTDKHYESYVGFVIDLERKVSTFYPTLPMNRIIKIYLEMDITNKTSKLWLSLKKVLKEILN